MHKELGEEQVVGEGKLGDTRTMDSSALVSMKKHCPEFRSINSRSVL